MYCKKCGKPITGDDELCYECRKDEVLFGGKAPEEEKRDNGARQDAPGWEASRRGTTLTEEDEKRQKHFVRAIVAAVCGSVGNGFSSLALALLEGNLLFDSAISTRFAAAFFLLSLSAAHLVLALVFGIPAICWFRTSRARGVKAVFTLVLGIAAAVGAAWIALDMTLCGIFFVVDLAVLL